MVDFDHIYGKVNYGKILIDKILWKDLSLITGNYNCFNEYMKISEYKRSRSVFDF